MKALSLLQPWASLVVTKNPNGNYALKSWETRSWKPKERNLSIIQKHGLLIHASKKWIGFQKELMTEWPFSDYSEQIEPMPFSAIIGIVRVGRILTTESWLKEKSVFEDGAAKHWAEEKAFGDYGPNRYAWEFTDFEKFDKPIPTKGALSLWDFDLETKSIIVNAKTKNTLFNA